MFRVGLINSFIHLYIFWFIKQNRLSKKITVFVNECYRIEFDIICCLSSDEKQNLNDKQLVFFLQKNYINVFHFKNHE